MVKKQSSFSLYKGSAKTQSAPTIKVATITGRCAREVLKAALAKFLTAILLEDVLGSRPRG